jgi:hypothetical protein
LGSARRSKCSSSGCLTGWKIDIKDPNTYAEEKEAMEKAASKKQPKRSGFALQAFLIEDFCLSGQ